MTLGTAAQLRSVVAVTTVDVAGSPLPVKPEVKSLGVIIDSHLRFDKHAAAIAKACNYHIHALRHVRHLLTDETARTIACSIVGSRLDYCNAVMYGALTMTINKLHRVQNNLARAVCRCSGRTDARPFYSNRCTGYRSTSVSLTRSLY